MPTRRDILLASLAAPLALLGQSPAFGWTLPAKAGFRVIDHQWVSMADGVRLSARLWLPETPARVPVVWEYIPYRKHDLYRAYDDAWGPQLAAHGIAFVRIDLRGSGNSEGVMTDEYDLPELADGLACIDWLSRQSWSNGSVGMRGISWGGINSLMLAAKRPPALKAVLALGTTDSRYTNDAHYIGGALGHTNFQWGTVFKNVMAAPPDPDVVGPAWRAMWQARLDATPAIMTRWLEHQTDDAYWQRGSIERDWGAIACPVYVVSGWADTYAPPIARLLANLKVPRKALIGPWGHTYPYLAAPAGLDWAQEEVRWWQQWLMGLDTGIMDEPMLRAWMPYATPREALPKPIPGRWVAAQHWPPAEVAMQPLHLHADGTLGGVAGTGKATVSGTALVGLSKPEWLDRLPVDQAPDDARSTSFTGPVLTAPVEILGVPRLRLRLSADRPQAQIAVRLTEVRADGRSWLVTYGLLNLTHRTSHSDPQPLVPGTAIDLDLPLNLIAHRFSPGSRIRVAVSASLWPLVWPAPQPVALTLDLAGAELLLPVRPAEAVPHVMAAAAIANPATPPEGVDLPAPDADGRVTIDHVTAPYAYPIAATGVEISGARRETSSIIPGQPESCRWSQSTRLGFKRGDWDCALTASYDLAATDLAFTLTETLVADEHGVEVFRRSSTRTVARNLL